MKKITALLLILVLTFSFCGVFAAEEAAKEIVRNGGFETLAEDGSPAEWPLSNGTLGTDFFVEKARPASGTCALKLASDKTSIYFGQDYVLKGGTELTVTFLVNVVSVGQDCLKVESTFCSTENYDPATLLSSASESFAISGFMHGRYVKKMVTFRVPEEAKYSSFRIRMFGEGEIYFDDISVIGEALPIEKQEEATAETRRPVETVEFCEPMEGYGELLTNQSFEELDGNGEIPGWSCATNDGKLNGNKVVSRVMGDVHSGEYAVKISGSGNPFITAYGIQVDEGDLYQVSIWAKMIERGGRGLTFKIEGYNDPVIQSAATADENNLSFNTETMVDTGEWQQFVAHFRPKPGTESIKLYARLYDGGTILLDDVSCYKIGGAKLTEELICDDRILYSDAEGTSRAYIDLLLENDETLKNCTAEFTLTKGETVIDRGTAVPDENGRCAFSFSVFNIREKATEYLMSVKVLRPDGTVVDSQTKDIYKYDRPTRLTKNGVYLMDGKPFMPVIAYHVDITREGLQELKENGVNVLQISTWWVKTKNHDGRMDELFALLEEFDMYALMCLYEGMLPAAHPNNIEMSRWALETYKNHPRIFAWNTQDEPYIILHYEGVEDDMAASYRLVREIDPDIPVLVVDSQLSPEKFAAPLRGCDIMLIDVYPGSDITWETAACLGYALESCDYDKTIYLLDQTFDYRNYFPTVDNIRHFAYTSFMVGSKGYGHYCYLAATKDSHGNSIDLNDTDRFPGLTELHLEELPELYEHFVFGQYPMFNEDRTEEFWYRSWVKDGKIRMALLSMSNDKGANVEIPMTGTDGKTVNKFAARVVKGGNVASVVSDDGILRYTLQPTQAVLLEISPMEESDFSPLYVPIFDDLEAYSWARNEIEAMAREAKVSGISENGFRPGEDITRIQFASWLISTMNLSTNITSSFIDVDSNSRYAGDIAAGKLEGILEGVGKNMFNPDDLITREDMMVMTSRALKLKRNGEVAAFPDGESVSDYAVEAVSAMIAEGFIQGDSFGNINPKGNATRAEAALMLYRIAMSGVADRA